MLQLHHQAFELAFEYPFTTAKGTKTHQPTFVVGLGIGSNWGWGEAPAIHYHQVTTARMQELIEAKRQVIERYALTDPQRFWHFLEHLLPGQSFLIAALDIAGWDVFARTRRQPLHQLLRMPQQIPMTDYTIGYDSPGAMLEKVNKHPAAIYKIKIQHADDIDIVRALRTATDKPIRIDANESLQPDEALRLLPEWEKLGVELVEQPLARTEHAAMQELKAKSSIPLFADESCVGEQDVAACAAGFHGINIKLSKCGGLTPAMRMIAEARKLGLRTMLGSMNESSIGTAALVQLAPIADVLDADGPLLLAEDVAEGFTYYQHRPVLSSQLGTGIRFLGQKIRK